MEWRRLQTADLPALLAFCKINGEYYSYIKKEPEMESLQQALTALPPDTIMEQKYFMGLWKDGRLAAILDVILGWPREGVAYIGWFMVAKELHRLGLGKGVITELLERLHEAGYHTARLGCMEANLPGLKFWQACGFTFTGEAVDDIRLMERRL